MCVLTFGSTSVNKPKVWIQPGLIAVHGASIDASPHCHHAIQIVWSDVNIQSDLNGKCLSNVTIISSQYEHELSLSGGWVILIEPNSTLGQALNQRLENQSYVTLNFPHLIAAKPSDNVFDYFLDLKPLFKALELDISGLLVNTSTVKDMRIKTLLTKLDQCLNDFCIKPSHWKASEVAEQLALSESRFLHLFKDELGIAWRPYLLWRRIMCAIYALMNNKTATEAAHIAGFSDSAHLSRTFRNNFGMTIRQAIKNLKDS